MLPSGKLGVHEEFPDEVAEAVRSSLMAWNALLGKVEPTRLAAI
jgi:hypothetical protein